MWITLRWKPYEYSIDAKACYKVYKDLPYNKFRKICLSPFVDGGGDGRI